MRLMPLEAAELTGHEQVARIASTQDGLITTAQLRAATGSRHAPSDWAARGLVHRLHLGVYAVGHTALTVRAHRRAALLAIGRGAALSHWSASALLNMQRSEPDVVHVGVSSGRVVSRPGIVVHHLHSLRPGDVTVVDGVRCTTAARTLVDLAGKKECRNLKRLCEQTEFLGLLDLPAIAETIERMSYPHGSRVLRELLAITTLGTSKAGSKFERRVLKAILDAPLGDPVLQQPFDLPSIGRIYVDFYWPEHNLVVEADGPHHKLPLQRAKDIVRDEALAAIGVPVVRIPQEDFDADPRGQIARIASAM